MFYILTVKSTTFTSLIGKTNYCTSNKIFLQKKFITVMTFQIYQVLVSQSTEDMKKTQSGDFATVRCLLVVSDPALVA